MNLTVYQSITINTIDIGAITNSSILQIGSAGSIQAHSESYNTGGFTEAAKPIPAPGAIEPFIPLEVPERST